MVSLKRGISLGLLASVCVGLVPVLVADAARSERSGRNSPDVRAPRLVSASVSGRRLTLSFDERLRAGALNPTSVTVSLNGRRVVVRSARATRRLVQLVLAEQAFGDDIVAVSFLRDSGGSVPRDPAGNEAKAFVRSAVSNRSLPGCTPTLDPGGLGEYSLTETPFPKTGVFAPSLGAVRAIALFVDFPDAPATESIAAVAAQVLEPMPHWYAAASYGRMQLSIDRLERWVRMPRASFDYGISRDARPSLRDLIADAVAAADAELDFGPYQLVYVLAPRDSGVTYSPALVLGPGSGVKADGAELRLGAAFGRDTRLSFGSRIAVHETAHALGLPDLYSHAITAANPGRSDLAVGNWDVMSELAAGGGLLAWHRWKLRWLDRGQLRCYRGGTRELELTPLDSPGGVKAIVIPVDASRAWVLELRRRQGLDAGLCDEGMLAYLVDATIPTGAYPIKIRPAGTGGDPTLTSRCGVLYDAPYKIAEGKPRVFSEPAFTVELIAPTDIGGYRIRIANRS